MIALMGMPRSGTSWLSQIFDSCPDVRFRLSPLFSYEFKNQLTENSDIEEWTTVLKGAYCSENEFMTQAKNKLLGHYPVFSIKAELPSTLVIKDTRFHQLSQKMMDLFPRAKIIYIVRNPCAMIYSWMNASREFPQGADILREWRSGTCRKTGFGEFWGFDDWINVTRIYFDLQKTWPDRCMIIRYEELVKDPVDMTKAMFDFCNLKFTPQTIEFLKACHEIHDTDDYAVFKNPKFIDKWRTGLPNEIIKAIQDELKSTELEVFLT